MAVTTNNGLRPVIYGCLASIFAIGRILLNMSLAKNSPATATRLIKHDCALILLSNNQSTYMSPHCLKKHDFRNNLQR